MKTFEIMQFDREVYLKIQEAELEAELTDKRCSPGEVWKAMLEAIGGDKAKDDAKLLALADEFGLAVQFGLKS